MPGKTKEHLIRNSSENQFEEFINTLEWEAHPPRHDYGLDYWIEVFEDGNSSGDHFHVQLKGTDKIERYSLKTKPYLYYEVPVKKLMDWHSNALPVYFILWDINNRTGYWLYMQDYIQGILIQDGKSLDRQDAGQKRIHIPISNEISTSEVKDFQRHVRERLVAIKDGKRAIQIIEQIRGISWHNTRRQIAQMDDEKRGHLVNTQQIALLEMHLKLTPDDVDTLIHKAWLHYGQMQFTESLHAINRAKSSGATSEEYFLNRGCILCEYANAHGGEPKAYYLEAIECFKAGAQKITPASFHYNIANCYTGLGDHEEAIKHYDMALSATPEKSLEAMIWKNRGTSFFHLAD